MTIKAGDVVSLKSGGPRMTVEYVDEENGLANCSWFTGNKPENRDFNLVTLALASEPGLGVTTLGVGRR